MPQVRVIDDQGGNHGILALAAALQLAREKGLDLVEVAPLAQPPVAKLMDFKKFKYHERKVLAKQKRIKLKTVKFGVRTGEHDRATKLRHVEAFLNQGHKVQVHLTMRGREKAHGDFAQEKLAEFLKLISVPFAVEQEPRRTPMGIVMIIRKK